MTQDEIRAIALEVARMDELMGPKDTFAFTKDRMVDFATRFLAAITAKAEPVAWQNTRNGFITKERSAEYQRPLYTHPAIEPAPQQASRDLQHEHTMNQFKEVCHGRNCTANKAQPTHSAECKADHDNAVGAAQLPDAAYMPKICVEPDAWATTDNCVGPNLGKVRYDKLPIQSLNPLQYTHEKMYSHRSVIGLMKAAYYDGYSEREKEVRAT